MDNKWALISDKVISVERAWRLVALPTLACQQIKSYLVYLQRLFAWLVHDGRGDRFRGNIFALSQHENTGFPLFFYLNVEDDSWRSITPGELMGRWGGIGGLPLNFSRHILATELLARSGRRDWVQIQLGHMDELMHPLGITSTESTQNILSSIRNHLDNLLQDQGWKHIPPPVRTPSSGIPPGAISRLLLTLSGNQR